jgi:hypothetical protein
VSQPLVLAIEPDLRQAAIVKRIVKDKALAEIVVVDSRDAAVESMRTAMPDVLLLSALMSPRDEDELIAYLKTLENAAHLQTHTIPQLASTLGPGEERSSRGLLSAFRRKKDPTPTVPGCDPEMFAEEIAMYLQRAVEKKRLLQNGAFTAPDMRPSAAATTRAAVEEPEEQAGPSSSWSSPFEWKPSGSSKRAAKTKAPEPAAPAAPAPEPWTPPPPPPPEPVIEAPPAVAVEAPIAAEPIVVPAAAAAAPEPVLVFPAPMPEPVVAAVVEAPVAAEPSVLKPAPVAAIPSAPTLVKPAAPEPVRLKPVADRPAKLTGRIQLHGLLRKPAVKDPERRDRLGSLARWAHIEAPRAVKAGPVTADDVRALISSLALPSDIASVSYPRGCRIRRLRVPVSRDQDVAEAGPVIASRRGAGERDKQQSA